MTRLRHAQSSPASLLIITLALLSLWGSSACGTPSEDGEPGDVTPDMMPTPQDMTTEAPDVTADLDDAAPDATSDRGDMADRMEDPTDTAPDEVLPEYDPCDALVPEQCVMPWPSSHYLAADAQRVTGYTLRFGAESLPRGRGAAKAIDPKPYERLDGYGLGVQGHFFLPDLDASELAGEEELERSMAPDSASLWFEVGTHGELVRVPHWVERDEVPEAGRNRAYFVRPAVILKPNTRYVIALRGLSDTTGKNIEPSEAFRRLRDGAGRHDPRLVARQPRFDEIFGMLEGAGITRDGLTLAWDFHTASREALTGPLLHMRDDALGLYEAGEGPPLTVSSVMEFAAVADDSGREVNPRIALQIEGTMEVPLYLEGPEAGPEAVLLRGAEGLPIRRGTRQAKIFIRVPHSAFDGVVQGTLTYGHGLLGTRYEIYAQHIERIAQDYHYVLVSADLIGMAAEDGVSAQATALDLDAFPRMADRLHQGILEYLLLTRAAKTTLAGLPALRDRGVTLNPDDTRYFGGSQGGIFGATYMALSTDVTRGFLAVPGNNYAMMLQRSVNFRDFQALLDRSYPRSLDAPVLISLLQLLWDGTDPISYMRHIKAEPLPGTPSHDVLLVASKGDYQVAVVTNEIAARSDLGIPVVGTYDATRSPWGVPSVPYPHEGSGLMLWDFGNPWPQALGNSPPDDGLRDPHSRQAEVDALGEVFETFLREGRIIDICQGGPCSFP